MPEDKPKYSEKLVHQPRKDTAREKQDAVAKTPQKTNDWDREAVHGDGDTVGIESDTE